MHERHTVAGRISQQHAVVGELLIGELTEMTPTADLQSRGESGVMFSAISSPLKFADHEGWIAKAKIETVAIASIGIGARTWWRRVAIENRK